MLSFREISFESEEQVYNSADYVWLLQQNHDCKGKIPVIQKKLLKIELKMSAKEIIKLTRIAFR